jgi:putative DNA methylase
MAFRGEKNGSLESVQRELLGRGTKTGHGANFKCLLTGTAISGDYIKSEGNHHRFSCRLMAIIVAGDRLRIYLSPTEEHIKAAEKAVANDLIDVPLSRHPQYMGCVPYGLDTIGSLFTYRQIVALSTFSELIPEACERAYDDARQARKTSDTAALSEGGVGTRAYAEAVATYLALMVNRYSDRGNALCTWDPGPVGSKSSTGGSARTAHVSHLFTRQAIPLVWDFAESNVFSYSGGGIISALDWIEPVLNRLNISVGPAHILSIDASKNKFIGKNCLISTDPPYYDNIPYADLSDFFYVWLRGSLKLAWPELFRRLVTPKEEELVADAQRHSNRENARDFFMGGMGRALSAMREAATDVAPLAVYYAFKQSELLAEGIASAGWASFLQAMVDTGLAVDGTWPVRSELANRMRSIGSNALASSIVLVCRKRSTDAFAITRAEFIRALKREMPDAIDDIRKAGVGPVDMQQSVIGPGMGVFTRYAKVLESDDSAMSVRTALSLINRVWEEIENELDANFDAETQVALAWFASYGNEAKSSGDLNVVANAKNVSDKLLFDSRVFKNLHGKAALTPRDELPLGWSPTTDRQPTVWRSMQQVARMLKASEGGAEAAARLVAEMGPRAADAQKLAYRLFEIATRKGLNDEALVYNGLAQEWARLEDIAASSAARTSANQTQPSFQF